MKISTPITPVIWYSSPAHEIAEFYTSIFENSKVIDEWITPDGGYSSVTFEIGGLRIIAFSGPGARELTEAMSLQVLCETQDEIDRIWSSLLVGGGKEIQCGWVKDRYGLAWQIVPSVLLRYMKDKDPTKAMRTMKAMMGMVKFDIAGIERAYAGE